MYARLVRFAFGPGKEDAARQLAAKLVPQIETQKGCAGATFFGDPPAGDYGIFILWETREDADEAAAAIGPQFQGALAGKVQAPPEIRLFDVL